VVVAVQKSVLGLYLPPVFNQATMLFPPPDDHFDACPDGSMKFPVGGRVGDRRGSPSVVGNPPAPSDIFGSI